MTGGQKARPILFSGPMVRALLSGAKTQTRRMLRPQPEPHEWQGMRGYSLEWRNPHDVMWLLVHRIPQNPVPIGQRFRCPYGSPGDLLWVRESHWRFTGCASDGKPWPGFVESPTGNPYDARCYDDYPAASALKLACAAVRVPSIHMPRWASRLTLRITDVRVERLQEISEQDAIAEGIECVGGRASIAPWADYCGLSRFSAPSRSFQSLWESINGSGSWGANPWVWALTFERVAPCN